MAELGQAALTFYRRLLGRPVAAGGGDAGHSAVLPGLAAVMAVEELITDGGGSGATFPAGGGARRLADRASDAGPNLFGRPPQPLSSATPRGALAAALGLALAGRRATAFLSGPDAERSVDLLAQAARQRLPLVIHLAERQGPGTAGAPGGAHRAYHALAGTGCFLLFAANAQEAVDLAVVARRVAEEALLPGVVAMDGLETALAGQDLLLPSAALLRKVVGDPHDLVHPPTHAQELLFGRHRRRLPRWLDPARPLLAGAAPGPEAAAPLAAARQLFFDARVSEHLEAALAAHCAASGRELPLVSTHQLRDAELVLVAEGAAVETAEAVADHLRARRRGKVGVVGLRALRPLPVTALRAALAGRPRIAVLERADLPLGGEGPLLSEVRPALEGESPEPRLASVRYGLGGFPLRGADLAELARQLLAEWRSPLYLGLDLAPTSPFPKRQALLDRMRREVPQAAEAGMRGPGPDPLPLPEGATTLAVVRPPERAVRLAGEVGTILFALAGGHLRSRPGVGWAEWGTPVVDRLTHAPEPFRDPGDDAPADLVVWAAPELPLPTAIGRLVEPGGVLLAGEEALATVPSSLAQRARAEDVRVYALPAQGEGQPEEDRLLGAVLGALAAEGRLELNERKLLAVRREELVGCGEEERVRRLDALQGGLAAVRRRPAAGLAPAPARSATIPAAARRLAGPREGVASLARFWDATGIVYRQEEAGEVAADPFLATDTLPAGSAALRDRSSDRRSLPAWDPALCTGCGVCWTVCPDAAVLPAVLSPGALLEEGMRRARAVGASADALRMVAGKVAAGAGSELARPDGARRAGPLLRAAFDRAMEATPLPEERKAKLAEAFAAVEEELAELPVCRSEPFFDAAEAERAGSGELLTLALDPSACKECGLCVAECEPEALALAPEDDERHAVEERRWEMVLELPSPSRESAERARSHPAAGPLEGALMTAAGRGVLTGGHGAEPGSGEAVAARQLLGAAAFHLEPRREALLSEVESLREALSAAIRGALARALPAGDLDALSAGLDRLDRPDAELSGLLGRVETAFETERVDVPRVRQLVEAARELADLHHHLTRGQGGRESAPFAVVVSGPSTVAWAGAFPDNPFTVPAVVDGSGEAAQLARGLAAGARQEAQGTARLLLRARALAEGDGSRREGPTEPAAEAVAERARELTSPVFLLASEASLAGGGMGGVLELLACDLPVVVAALADGALAGVAPVGSEGPAREGPAAADLALLALSGARGHVVQGSIAHGAQLDAGVAAVLETGGPALVRLLAPSPGRHGFPADATVERARQAVAARVAPLLRRDPATGTLDLEGNPDPGSAWTGEEGAVRTPADWARHETRFARLFSPWTAEEGEGVPLAEVLGGAEAAAGKTATVAGEDETVLAVAPALVAASADRLTAWRALQTLAPSSREEEPPAEAETVSEERHRAELEALHRDYEARMTQLRAGLQQEMAQKIRRRLLALATRPQDPGGGSP